MPQTPHIEHHFTAGETVRDIVIGMSDGLTVPFALAAGLSGAVMSTGIVVTAGLAEIAAGSIAMGLGGYLAAKGDAEHYASELAREKWEVKEKPVDETNEVVDVLQSWGVPPDKTEPIVKAFHQNHEAWINFMMRFELGLEKPNPARALKSGLTIGSAYLAGGFIPLAPYIFSTRMMLAFKSSVIVTLFALFIFGYIKGRFTGTRPLRGAIHTTLIGGIAATAAFLIARAVS